MISKDYIKYSLLVLAFVTMLIGCGGTEKSDAEFPWSINVPELSVRLVVLNKRVEAGQYPECMMEVMNTSKQTILLRKDFSLNGPAVYDKDGNPMPQRRPLEVKSGEIGYYRIEPGKKVSVKAAPNYKMENPGAYFMKFAVPSEWWGFEDTQNPGKIAQKDSILGATAISNEARILVYSGEK